MIMLDVSIGRSALAFGVVCGAFLLFGACDNSGEGQVSACETGTAVCRCSTPSDCSATQDCVNNQCVPKGQATATTTGGSTGMTGVGGTSSTSSTSGGDAGAAGESSTTTSATATTGSVEVMPPAVVLLLDRSTSADEHFSDDLTRWEAIQAALTDEDGPVAQAASDIALGVVDYTGFNGDTCPVLGAGVAPAEDNFETVAAYVADLTLPEEDKSETPTREGIEEAARLLAGHNGPKAIILITDGLTDDTCSEFDNPGCVSQAYYAAQQAYAAGVHTYILGLTDLEDDYLQGVANAGVGEPVAGPGDGAPRCGAESEQPETSEPGGSARFWQAESAEELTEDLDAILQRVLAP